MALNIVDAVKELSRQGITPKHLGRRYVDKVQRSLVSYRNRTKVYGEGDDYMHFYQDPKTGSILAVDFSRDYRTGGVFALRYAVMGSDGKVLPDPECCGEVHGNKHKLDEFLARIQNGFNPF